MTDSILSILKENKIIENNKNYTLITVKGYYYDRQYYILKKEYKRRPAWLRELEETESWLYGQRVDIDEYCPRVYDLMTIISRKELLREKFELLSKINSR